MNGGVRRGGGVEVSKCQGFEGVKVWRGGVGGVEVWGCGYVDMWGCGVVEVWRDFG